MIGSWSRIAAAVALAAGVTAISLLHAEERGLHEYAEYEGASVGDTATRARLRGRPIAIKDTFDERLRRLPRDVERAGVTTRRFAVFRAQEGYGSGLLSVVRRDDESSMQALEDAVRGDDILMYGRIQRLGTVDVFAVERLIRGHTPPPTRAITLTVTDAGGDNERTYRLREPGQTYRIRSPYDDRVLHVSFKPH